MARNAQSSGVEVLLVDDDSETLALMATQLQAAGLRVGTALGGREALAKISAAPPGVIVADVRMPGMSGYELCQLVRAMGHDGIPFIFCSALNGLPERVTGLRAGADDYLPKRTSPEELVLRIRGHLSRTRRLAGLGRPASAGAVVLTGLLGDVAVATVFQIVEILDLEAIRVLIEARQGKGTVYVQGKLLVHASTAGLTGTKAFFRMLDWREGRFTIEHGAWNGECSVTQRLDRSLLEGLAHLDECRRLLSALGANGDAYAVLVDDGSPRPMLDSESAGVLELFKTHRTLDAVLDATPLSDLRALRIVCQLLTKGIIARRVPAEAGRAAPHTGGAAR